MRNFSSAFLAVLATSLLPAAASAQTVVNTIRSSGTSVDMGHGDEFSYTYVSAYEMGDTVAININRYWVDPSSYTCVTETWYPCDTSIEVCEPITWENCHYATGGYGYAWGVVDASTFRTAGRNEAAVLVATLDSSNGIVDECVWGPETTECTSGGAISLDVTWNKNNKGTGTSNSRWSSTSGQFGVRQAGSWTYAMADVSGTVAGRDVTGGGGNISSSNNLVIERFRSN